MFERRLKVFLAVLLLVTMTLVLRAAKLQVLEHDAWVEHAAKLTTRSEHLEPQRGTIRDYRGVVLAMDETCVDACVDYRALVPDSDKRWIADVARARLTDRLGALYTDATLDRRRVLLAKEVEQVRADLRDLVPRLARVCGRKEQELEDVRQGIIEKVKMRQRWVWYYNYVTALDKHNGDVKAAETRPS